MENFAEYIISNKAQITKIAVVNKSKLVDGSPVAVEQDPREAYLLVEVEGKHPQVFTFTKSE